MRSHEYDGVLVGVGQSRCNHCYDLAGDVGFAGAGKHSLSLRPDHRGGIIVAVKADSLVGDIVGYDHIEALALHFGSRVFDYIASFRGKADCERSVRQAADRSDDIRIAYECQL